MTQKKIILLKWQIKSSVIQCCKTAEHKNFQEGEYFFYRCCKPVQTGMRIQYMVFSAG